MRFQIFSFFLLALCCLQTYADDSSEESEVAQKLSGNAALKKLVKLIEENKMNVTIVASEISHHSNGKLKEASGFSISFPPNEGMVTESKLNKNKQQAQDWLKLVETSKLTGRTNRIIVKDGEVEKVVSLTTDAAIPKEDQPQTIVGRSLNNVHKGHRGFAFNKPDFAVLLHFVHEGADGKNETTDVLMDHVTVTVLKKSPAITDAEVSIMEKIIPKIAMVFESDTDKAKSLVGYLDEKLPQNNWQVIINPVEYYVASPKYISIKALNKEYLLFALKK